LHKDGKVFVQNSPEESIEISHLAQVSCFKKEVQISGHGQFVDKIDAPKDALDYGICSLHFPMVPMRSGFRSIKKLEAFIS
jgi:hypothetical protein